MAYTTDFDSLTATSFDTAGTIYEYDFYSGSQVNCLIGDILIDNAVSLAYSVEQTRTPVFGYASQYYSFLSEGHVMVQGTLAIAFKEAGYLLSSLARFQRMGQTTGGTTPRMRVSDNGLRLHRGVSEAKTDSAGNTKILTLSQLSGIARDHENLRQTAEQVVGYGEWQESFPEAKGFYNKRYHDFWNELGHVDDEKWENWAEAFEDTIWYASDTQNPYSRDKLFSKNLPPGWASGYGTSTSEDILSHRRADQYPPVDIWITYGDLNNSAANHTVRKLMDVSFLGQSQTIEISGSPVFELYNFIARNVV